MSPTGDRTEIELFEVGAGHVPSAGTDALLSRREKSTRFSCDDHSRHHAMAAVGAGIGWTLGERSPSGSGEQTPR
jgi:hypothetical protein